MSSPSIISVAKILELSNSLENELNPEISNIKLNDSKFTEDKPNQITIDMIERVNDLQELVDLVDHTIVPSSEEDRAIISSSLSLKVTELISDDISNIFEGNLNKIVSEEIDKITKENSVSDLAEVRESPEGISEISLESKLKDSINERLSDLILGIVEDKIESISKIEVNNLRDNSEGISEVTLNHNVKDSIDNNSDSVSLNNEKDDVEPISNIDTNKSNESAEGISEISDNDNGEKYTYTTPEVTQFRDTSSPSISPSLSTDNVPNTVSISEGTTTSPTVEPLESITNSDGTEDSESISDVSGEYALGVLNPAPNLTELLSNTRIGDIVSQLIDWNTLHSNLKTRVSDILNGVINSTFQVVPMTLEFLTNELDDLTNGAVTTTISLIEDILDLDVRGVVKTISGLFKSRSSNNDFMEVKLELRKLTRTQTDYSAKYKISESVVPELDNKVEYSNIDLDLSNEYELDSYKTSKAINEELKLSKIKFDDKFRGISELPSRESFQLDDDSRTWYLENSYDWTMDIRPYSVSYNSNVPPDLYEYIYGELRTNSNKYYSLPIMSYTINEGDLVYDKVKLNYSTMDILMTPYNYPSTLSIELPVTVNYSSRYNSIVDWQTDYIDYVKLGDRFGMVSRDYRECYYKLTLRKLINYKSDRSSLSIHSYVYYVIPIISKTLSGSSVKSPSSIKLDFSIIGDEN